MLRSFFPFLDWSSEYRVQDGMADCLAALIVTIMLIPQSLAYALLAGLPAQAGLYASILPLVVYAIFGSSRVLAVGPVAVISLMTAVAVGQIYTPETPEYWGAAIVLAFISGVLLLLMGLLKMGWLANFLSHPVITGFITASGILIAATQLKHLLGIPIDGHNLPDILMGLMSHLSDSNLYSLSLGIGALAFLFFARRSLKPLLQALGTPPSLTDFICKAAPVFAIVMTTLAVVLYDLEQEGVSIVGAVPLGLPEFAVPAFDLALWQSLLPAAFLISLIGFVESVSVAQTLAAKRRQKINPDQELIGLGGANIVSAVSSGFPVTGGFSRSMVNYDAGARTPFAGVLTALAILLTTLLVTDWFYFLPKATLGATIIIAVLSLVDLKAFKRTFKYSKVDCAVMVITVSTVILLGVELGILAGVLASLFLFLWKTSRPHIAIVGLLPGTEHFRNIERHQVETLPNVLMIRVDESLYFANSRYLESQVLAYTADQKAVEHVVLMCSAVNAIDSSALEGLEALVHRLASAGITLHLSEVKGPVMDHLQDSEILHVLTGNVFLSQFEAWQYFNSPS